MLLKKMQIDLKEMNNVVESLVGTVKGKLPIDEEGEFRIRLVSKELLTNILLYSDATDILLSATLEKDVLVITIEDDGAGFEYRDLVSRDVREGDSLMSEGGRGVYLVRMMAEELKFNDRGNTVEVKLKLQ